MKRLALVAALLCGAAIVVCCVALVVHPAHARGAGSARLLAQATAPAATIAPSEDTESESKPWIRLVFFVPASIVVGVGSLVVLRKLRDVGWIES